jgi:RNA polymerase subunit RPABC4/transcription elongation factor Spt4
MLPLQTLTLVVLCGLPLQWPYRTWPTIPRDLLAGFLCFYGHSIAAIPPRLPLSLAIAYVVWVSTPGSFSSLTLPRHWEFMHNLALSPDEEPEECKICWDDARLAQMPCGHRFCKRCPQLMGEQFQTACPMCRAPLFSKHDRAMFIVSKSAVAISAVNLAIHALRVTRKLQARRYALAVVSLGSMSPMIFHLLFTVYQCRTKGENWWRDSAASSTEPTRGQLKGAGFALVTGLFLFVQTLWVTRSSMYA